jgi:hypothetical protein
VADFEAETMSGRYAKSTEVSTEKSRAEIETTLRRYGADQFIYGWQEGGAVIGFRAHGRQIKFLLPLPAKDEERFTHATYGGRGKQRRSADAAYAAWEQACRQAWRALALVIKAKLEAVEAGITCFEDEFLAHIVLPNGKQVGEWFRPQLSIAYERGDMPPLLSAPSSGE